MKDMLDSNIMERGMLKPALEKTDLFNLMEETIEMMSY